MEAETSSETSINNYHRTWYITPEDPFVQSIFLLYRTKKGLW